MKRSGITVCVPSAAVRNKNNGVAAAMIRFASMAPTLRNVESDARSPASARLYCLLLAVIRVEALLRRQRLLRLVS